MRGIEGRQLHGSLDELRAGLCMLGLGHDVADVGLREFDLVEPFLLILAR